jgi:hypothetical protein
MEFNPNFTYTSSPYSSLELKASNLALHTVALLIEIWGCCGGRYHYYGLQRCEAV